MTHLLAGSFQLEPLDINDDAFAEICLILEMKRNFSMAMYKDKCMKRRIAIRMRSCRCSDAASYCHILRQNDHELDLLKKTLTIHVSQFFRNPSMFSALQDTVFPELFQQQSSPVRILSLGCAGGEEAYGIAIILKEYFPAELLSRNITIHGYDIDSETLITARQGEYVEERLKDLPETLRSRYFSQHGPRHRLSDEIRQMVDFVQLDLMNVASLEPAHMALCRNTLIYFTRQDQERILRGIADILPAGGILILGKSETLVGEARRYFTTVCPVERIYRRTS